VRYEILQKTRFYRRQGRDGYVDFRDGVDLTAALGHGGVSIRFDTGADGNVGMGTRQENKSMIKFKSIQQRLSIFMLLPVAILLLSMGFAGFLYTRNRLLTQWGEATILKLQRAAHHVDMRLSQPKEMLKLFHNSAGLPYSAHIQGLILDQLKALEWVTDVDLTWMNLPTYKSEMHHHIHERRVPGGVLIREEFMMMPFHRGSIVAITPPAFRFLRGQRDRIAYIGFERQRRQNNRSTGSKDRFRLSYGYG